MLEKKIDTKNHQKKIIKRLKRNSQRKEIEVGQEKSDILETTGMKSTHTESKPETVRTWVQEKTVMIVAQKKHHHQTPKLVSCASQGIIHKAQI